MVFSDYMNSLSTKAVSEKKAAVMKIAEATNRDEQAVYSWIAGRNKPDKLVRKIISGVLNIPEGELFPDAE